MFARVCFNTFFLTFQKVLFNYTCKELFLNQCKTSIKRIMSNFNQRIKISVWIWSNIWNHECFLAFFSTLKDIASDLANSIEFIKYNITKINMDTLSSNNTLMKMKPIWTELFAFKMKSYYSNCFSTLVSVLNLHMTTPPLAKNVHAKPSSISQFFCNVKKC